MSKKAVEKVLPVLEAKERLEPFSLELDHIGPGEKARLAQLMCAHGPGNGKMLILPVDQGLEHGPSDFLENPPAEDFEFQLSLAAEGGFSGIACHIGLAEKHYRRWAEKIPLILKINGRTNIPPGDAPLSPLDASVEDALRLGAVAVGYTCYVGSPRQDEDFRQFMEVRQEARRVGMPVIMWAYPRGEFVEGYGGRNSLAAVAYAARVACELGAHIVKVNFPGPPKGGRYSGPFEKYNQLPDLSPTEAFRMVVRAAGRSGVLLSGGGMVSEEDLLSRVRDSLEAGVDGIIFGRNIWQRPYDDALALAKELKELLQQY